MLYLEADKGDRFESVSLKIGKPVKRLRHWPR